jgi:hypothetical protein
MFVTLGPVKLPILVEHTTVPVLRSHIHQVGCHVVDGDYDICAH